MQRIEIIGLIGKDAEVKDVGSNQVINFSVAVTEKRNDQEYTTWFEIAKWGNNVSVAPYIKKGGKIFIAGKVNNRAYANSNGETTVVNGINAFEIELLSRAPEASQQQGQSQPPRQTQTSPQQYGDNVDDDDQLPF